MSFSEKRIKTDVLVIGGGMAGCFAAIKAKQRGLDVTLVDKGHIGKTGATHYADGNLMYFRPERGHNITDWLNLISVRGEYLNNRDWVEICLKESRNRYDDMVSWGVPFYKPDGKLFINRADPSWTGMDDIIGSTDKGAVWENVDFVSRKNAPALRKKALDYGVNILDRIMTCELLKQDGKVIGAIGFHTTSGDLYVFQSKATVIATGSGAFKAENNLTNYWTGDGEAMAYRAGATVSGQEFCRVGTDMPIRTAVRSQKPADISNKTVDTLAHYPFITGGLASWLRPTLNAEGGAVIGAAWEVHCGRAPLYSDLDAWSEGQMKWIKYYIDSKGAEGEERAGFDFFKRGKVQFPATRIWLAPTAAGAGIWPEDMNLATGVPGLYAAGDSCATMACGASYAGLGFGLNHAAVTGSRAGLGAAEFALKLKSTDSDGKLLAGVKNNVCNPLERAGGFTAAWLTQIVQTITVPYYILGVKKEDRLRAALTLAEFINNHLSPKVMAKDPHEWRMAYEAKNMALIAEMRLQASLFRTESRGSHFREDYPRRDDPTWLAWVKLKEKDGKIAAFKEPLPGKWWPDLTKKYEERYPRMFPGE